MSVPCQVLIPKGEQPQGGFPAILCCHGHGKFGKDPVAGGWRERRNAGRYSGDEL